MGIILLQTKYEQQESELQLRIDEERSKKTALETSRTMKGNSLVCTDLIIISGSLSSSQKGRYK